MKRKTLELLACPSCRGELSLLEGGDSETIETGILVCAKCQRQYPIQDGIPHFIKIEELGELNRRFAKMYDTVWNSANHRKKVWKCAGIKPA